MSLDAILASLDRDQLQALLMELVERQPDLADLIEARATVLQRPPSSPPAGTPTPPQPQALTDPAPFRKQVRSALRSVRRDRYDDYDDEGGEVMSEIAGIVEEAQPYVEAGDGRSALVILSAVADEYLDDLDEFADYEDTGTVCEDLGALMTEALLSADLTPQEQKEWAQRTAGWRKQAADYGLGNSLDAAHYAALQGWNYPPLVRAMQGEITERGAWEGEAPDGADELAEARLNVLERQGRFQEFLHLAQAESQTVRYVTMLVRLGRVAEAVEYSLKHLTTRGDLLVVAKALHAQGASEEALRVGEHGLTLEQPTTFPNADLARWTRDLAREMGRTELALKAALIVARESTTLESYQAVQDLAGERWPELREELLTRVRQMPTYYPSNQIEIFLHEKLFEDAMAVVDASPRHELVERVADAVFETHPDWVFRACCHQFDRIADAGKSTYYWAAAQWLEKARNALVAAGRGNEWLSYIDDVIARHARKRNLRPMLERLRSTPTGAGPTRSR